MVAPSFTVTLRFAASLEKYRPIVAFAMLPADLHFKSIILLVYAVIEPK